MTAGRAEPRAGARAPHAESGLELRDAVILPLPHRSSAVREGRRQVVTDLRARGVDASVVDEVEVVVSELLGNAVRHAPPLLDGTVRLRWQVQGSTVDVEVADGGGAGDIVPQHPVPWATSGRGLRIVRCLAHEWGVLDPAPGGGRVVWAALGGPSRRHR